MCRPSYHWQILLLILQTHLISLLTFPMFQPCFVIPSLLSLQLLSLSTGSFPSAFKYSSVFPVHEFCHFSVPTLCNPMDYSPPGSSVHGIHQVTIPAWVASVHGILQVRIPVWVAMPSSRGSYQPSDQTHISWQVGPLPLAPPGKPQ